MPADQEGPCPNCGDAGETDYLNDDHGCWYQCNVCGMRGPRIEFGDDHEADFAEALSGWNRLSGLREALESVASNIEYMQGVWGKEGVTERIAQTVRAALGKGARGGE